MFLQVVKENFSRDLAELLVEDFMKAMAYLDKDHREQQVGRGVAGTVTEGRGGGKEEYMEGIASLTWEGMLWRLS